MAKYKVCPRCRGTCFEDEWEMTDCEYCDGLGEIELVEVDVEAVVPVLSDVAGR